MFLEIYAFLLGFSVSCYIIVHPRLLQSFVFLWRALDFMRERLHRTSLGDLGSMFIKSGDHKMKERLRVEEEQERASGCPALAF